jgi:hypothetical protein
MEQLAAALAYLGVSPPDMFAGFCGSIVYVSVAGTKPGKVLLTMLANTLLANYFGVATGMYAGATAGHIGALMVGWGGPALVKKVIELKAPGFFEDKSEPHDGKP